MFRSVTLAIALAIAALISPGLGTPAANGAASVTITLRCYSNPEKTTIKNTGTVSFKVQKVGSTYHAYSYEPFRVNKTLGELTIFVAKLRHVPERRDGNSV